MVHSIEDISPHHIRIEEYLFGHKGGMGPIAVTETLSNDDEIELYNIIESFQGISEWVEDDYALKWFYLPSGKAAIIKIFPDSDLTGRSTVFGHTIILSPEDFRIIRYNPFILNDLDLFSQDKNLPERMAPKTIPVTGNQIADFNRLNLESIPEGFDDVFRAVMSSSRMVLAANVPANRLLRSLVCCLPTAARSSFTFSTLEVDPSNIGNSADSRAERSYEKIRLTAVSKKMVKTIYAPEGIDVYLLDENGFQRQTVEGNPPKPAKRNDFAETVLSTLRKGNDISKLYSEIEARHGDKLTQKEYIQHLLIMSNSLAAKYIYNPENTAELSDKDFDKLVDELSRSAGGFYKKYLNELIWKRLRFLSSQRGSDLDEHIKTQIIFLEKYRSYLTEDQLDDFTSGFLKNTIRCSEGVIRSVLEMYENGVLESARPAVFRYFSRERNIPMVRLLFDAFGFDSSFNLIRGITRIDGRELDAIEAYIKSVVDYFFQKGRKIPDEFRLWVHRLNFKDFSLEISFPLRDLLNRHFGLEFKFPAMQRYEPETRQDTPPQDGEAGLFWPILIMIIAMGIVYYLGNAALDHYLDGLDNTLRGTREPNFAYSPKPKEYSHGREKESESSLALKKSLARMDSLLNSGKWRRRDNTAGKPKTASEHPENTDIQTAGKTEVMGTLYIQTFPKNAKVRIMNIIPTYTPGMRLKKGNYDIEVSGAGYLPQRKSIKVKGGERNTYPFTLTPIPVEPKLTVTSTPAGAGLWIDGAFVGKTPVENHELNPGTYSITLKLEGYNDKETNLTIESGKDQSIGLVLEEKQPPLFPLYITTTPSYAKIVIKGKGRDIPYTSGMKLAPGTYAVIITRDTYQPLAETVTVTEESGNPYHYALEKLPPPPPAAPKKRYMYAKSKGSGTEIGLGMRGSQDLTSSDYEVFFQKGLTNKETLDLYASESKDIKGEIQSSVVLEYGKVDIEPEGTGKYKPWSGKRFTLNYRCYQLNLKPSRTVLFVSANGREKLFPIDLEKGDHQFRHMEIEDILKTAKPGTELDFGIVAKKGEKILFVSNQYKITVVSATLSAQKNSVTLLERKGRISMALDDEDLQFLWEKGVNEGDEVLLKLGESKKKHAVSYGTCRLRIALNDGELSIAGTVETGLDFSRTAQYFISIKGRSYKADGSIKAKYGGSFSKTIRKGFAEHIKSGDHIIVEMTIYKKRDDADTILFKKRSSIRVK